MAPKKRSSLDLLKAAQSAGTAIQEQDRQSEVRSTQSKVSTLPLSKIIDRLTDTRSLKYQHVEDLMKSIAALGLLEPLVVDSRGRLLAGGHRKAAIYLLKKQMPIEYIEHFPNELVPVRVLGFDANQNGDLALQVEIAENEKRRDYTPAEVRTLAERLKSAGYIDTKGRPAIGEKPLRPALQVIIGKSIRTVQRYLNENEELSTTDVRLNIGTNALTNLKTSLVKWQKMYGSSNNDADQSPSSAVSEAIERDVAKLLRRLENEIKKS